MRFTIVQTSLGGFGFVTRAGRLVAAYLPRDARRVRTRVAEAWPDAVEDRELLPGFRRAVADYFDGKRVAFRTGIDLGGLSLFQRNVLEACRRIPYGETASYADLARAVGKPGAARAVGGVMARNPIPLIIPCHRVVRRDGTIGGFSSPGSIREKKRMLALEGVDLQVRAKPCDSDEPRRSRRAAGEIRSRLVGSPPGRRSSKTLVRVA